ncbi:hypothetical protein BDZ85DRAFT_268857 [Elsinoe ampelina]|uniref:Uncharacterized protein n=1 Tax=Elsinoe ampelina TaxID=302913 RepID=A0A6A6G132_9PEZI|nr:hypothetical protein BDZ85DRAFT_268857 [Elsinoe ampelina]
MKTMGMSNFFFFRSLILNMVLRISIPISNFSCSSGLSLSLSSNLCRGVNLLPCVLDLVVLISSSFARYLLTASNMPKPVA